MWTRIAEILSLSVRIFKVEKDSRKGRLELTVIIKLKELEVKPTVLRWWCI
jgi:hypothetical protein